ncbi:MAG: hypothetical protein M0Z53_03620 [Thermaerobacter sp.]|nr:hypothetical protein [Thermaerobacter sp.]
MGYVISLEMQDHAGALQRLLLLLGQRNVTFEYFAALTDETRRVMQVTIGIAADQRRAAWVNRQLSRHKGVIQARLAPFEDTEVLADVSVREHAPLEAPQTVSVMPSTNPQRMTVRGSHRAVEAWMRQNQATPHAVYRWRLGADDRDETASSVVRGLPRPTRDTQTQQTGQTDQGGFRYERKIVLRRQRRSEVVGG